MHHVAVGRPPMKWVVANSVNADLLTHLLGPLVLLLIAANLRSGTVFDQAAEFCIEQQRAGGDEPLRALEIDLQPFRRMAIEMTAQVFQEVCQSVAVLFVFDVEDSRRGQAKLISGRRASCSAFGESRPGLFFAMNPHAGADDCPLPPEQFFLLFFC